ncbi:hypothetical protein [Chryseobacterium camelliae]|uniref:hypothetical protein n=1 Tax=Chryseobacterium camelliae TaxID=1265445 RepID=UPI00285C059A|nr:hypothetical protein [Chryseobacterium camelliae]MDR6517305.1 hypothetical protein [Chryseobacterium camelliae]
MKNIFMLITGIFIISSCTKEKNKIDRILKKENFTSTEYFSIPTDYKKWKNYDEIIINDSLKKISGDFNQYRIEGFINNENKKINWWIIKNKADKNADNARIEYRIIDGKEYVNQYISFNSKGDYITNSMFYSKENLNIPNFVRYKFFTPSKKAKINSLAKFSLYYLYDGKEIKSEDLKCQKKDNYYYVDLNTPKKQNIVIKGLFEEGYQYTNGEMGVNNIYILDTLK